VRLQLTKRLGKEKRMATKAKRTRSKRPVPTPRQPPAVGRRPNWLPWAAIAIAAIAIGIGAFVVQRKDEPSAAPARGLPQTPDYHALLVAPGDPNRILLGTHQGIYASVDGGRVWRFEGFAGNDAMNLVRARTPTLWTAGHDVLAKSSDGGKTWTDVRPSGLPSLDVHGFAVDPGSGRLFAAVAGRGLYRSSDGGSSFQLASGRVGGAVMALAVAPGGRLLAADMEQGLLETRDGGKSWRRLLGAQLAGLAVDPQEPRRILATGPGVLLSVDGGRSWRQVLKLEQGAGPVAWAPSARGTGYVVGFDRTLYRSRDGGRTWKAVT
jgi:photosystem II stability/assembly factor-like uncharacterized protein